MTRGENVARVPTDSVDEAPGNPRPTKYSAVHTSHLDAEGRAFRWANCLPGEVFLRVPKRRQSGVPASVGRLFAIATAEGSGLLAFTDDPRAVREGVPTYQEDEVDGGTGRSPGGGPMVPGTAALPFDHEFDSEPVTPATFTLSRIGSLIEMRSGRDPDLRGKKRAARRSDLPPAFRAALEGELMLLRAQLFSTGLFRETVCTDLGGGG